MNNHGHLPLLMILWVDWALLGASSAWCVSQGNGHLEAQPGRDVQYCSLIWLTVGLAVGWDLNWGCEMECSSSFQMASVSGVGFSQQDG